MLAGKAWELSILPPAEDGFEESEQAARARAAERIQQQYRGRFARNELEEKKRAANTIQNHMRGKLARKELDGKHAAATRIQASFRGRKARQDLGDGLGRVGGPGRGDGPSKGFASDALSGGRGGTAGASTIADRERLQAIAFG